MCAYWCQADAVEQTDEWHAARAHWAERLGQGQTVDPALAHELAFGAAVDAVTAVYIRRYYPRPGTVSVRGWIYVFRDARDAHGVLKIGMTRGRNPEWRVQQWRHQLDGGPFIRLVAAFPCRHARRAERIVHALLQRRRLNDRRDPSTGRLLTEYFAVPEWRSLLVLIRSVTIWLDASTIRFERSR